MTTTMRADGTWASALSSALNRPVEWDGTGECTLEFEGNVDVTFTAMPQAELMVVRSSVTFEEQTLTSGALRLALTLNYAQLPPGYTLAMDDATGQFALLAVLHDRQSMSEDLLALLDGFQVLVPQLRALLAAPDFVPQNRPQDSAMILAGSRY